MTAPEDIDVMAIMKAKKMAPAAGFEPATKWLTATYSTAELCRIKRSLAKNTI